MQCATTVPQSFTDHSPALRVLLMAGVTKTRPTQTPKHPHPRCNENAYDKQKSISWSQYPGHPSFTYIPSHIPSYNNQPTSFSFHSIPFHSAPIMHHASCIMHHASCIMHHITSHHITSHHIFTHHQTHHYYHVPRGLLPLQPTGVLLFYKGRLRL